MRDRESNIKWVFPDIETEKQFNSEEKGLEQDIYDLVVVGGGLAGLAAAADASLAGKRVLVIESRKKIDSDLRPQLIYLEKGESENEESENEESEYASCRYLYSLYARSFGSDDKLDEKFLNKLNDPRKEHFGIKDIQRYLKRRIDTRFCTFLYESTVSSIQVEEGYLIASHAKNSLKKEKIKFKDLILADGAKHSSANLLKQYVHYQPVQDRPEKNHVMAYFTVKSKNENFELPFDFFATVRDGVHCGLIYYERSSLEKGEQNALKLCIVMHVPDELFKKFEIDKAIGIQYLKHCAGAVFNEKDFDIFMTHSQKYPEKDNLKYATFSLDFEEANRAAFEKNGHKVILAGCAFRRADFYVGHGGNDAIFYAEKAVQLIRGKITLQAYNLACKKKSNEVSKKTKQHQPIYSVILELGDDGPSSFYASPFIFEKSVLKADVGAKLSSGKVGLFSFGHAEESSSSLERDKAVRENAVFRP